MEGCKLYAECRRLAPDFHLRIEVWSRGRQVVWRGTVHACLYVGTRVLPGDPMGNVLALCGALSSARTNLLEAHGLVA